ncbi:mercuric transport protein periplasmic component [Rhodopseudomonas boonkerdii]|jgi:mercuric ion binding protein|uniref:cation transporter n=1 Tax=Nitrobacteraceae TaxID=41294 RepID=UPI000BDD0ABB|nr:cation transporter [Rhodopseudomonas boonkerdii]OYU89029.1 MAG: mercuric transport protein periplasmic component [Bradyrhizobiaceae bacterium PARB1]UGV24619.1 mercuric transport protein periplasmic component [Rhodopseudomonas boonkerdii]
MSKLLLRAVLTGGILASSAAMAADRAVDNMYCAACPSIVKGSREAIPGVARVVASFKEKTATVVYRDTVAVVNGLMSATAKAGHPSAPRG